MLKGRELATEERFYQKQQEAIRRMDAEEDLRDEEEEEKRKLVAKVREAQVAQQRQIHNARLAEIKREGEVMAQKAVADLEQEKRQRVEALEHEQKIRAEFVEANKALLGRCAPRRCPRPAPPHPAPAHAARAPQKLPPPPPVCQPENRSGWMAYMHPWAWLAQTACPRRHPQSLHHGLGQLPALQA